MCYAVGGVKYRIQDIVIAVSCFDTLRPNPPAKQQGLRTSIIGALIVAELTIEEQLQTGIVAKLMSFPVKRFTGVLSSESAR